MMTGHGLNAPPPLPDTANRYFESSSPSFAIDLTGAQIAPWLLIEGALSVIVAGPVALGSAKQLRLTSVAFLDRASAMTAKSFCADRPADQAADQSAV